jgi:putative phosphoesterase
MRIALIADSHGRLPVALWGHLAGCDEIFHLGDLGQVELLDDLGAVAPVLAVGGNVDLPGLPELPPSRRLERLGLVLHLRHEPWAAREIDGGETALYLHGHTHLPRIVRDREGYIVCPGALQRPRGRFPASLGLLDLSPERIALRIVPVEGSGTVADLILSRS